MNRYAILCRLGAIAALVAALPMAAEASSGLVSITGQLTSFQSALSPYYANGNGSVDGVALAIDPSLASVIYSGGDTTLFPQSKTVALAAGTTSVQFEYSDARGTAGANPNVVSFTAASPAVVSKGDTFKIGTLSYTNGFWYPYASIGLSITTHSGVTALDGHTFTGNIIVKVSSPIPFDPTDYVANADYFYLQDATGPLSSLGSVRVYEKAFQPPSNPGNTGSVDLYAQIGSLIPRRFDNPSTGAFLSSSLDPIVSSVPEPGSYALFAAGLVALATRMRRARPSERAATAVPG